MARKPTAAPHSAADTAPPSPPVDARVFSQPPKVGRPTKYEANYPEQAEKLCALGATDVEVAAFFNVCKMTIYRWQAEYPEFAASIRTGKEAADERVERSLFQMAVGYEHETVKIFMPAGAETPVYAEHREHVQANPTAAIFWLKNRRRELWRDKQEVEHTGGISLNVTPDDAAL